MPATRDMIASRTSFAALAFSTCFLLLPAAALAVTPDFYGHWADGKAELSSYRVVQSRYGEPRQGYGIFVFVTEDINRQTLIKVESAQPVAERIHVLKLNNILKFTTGIYDYSVMTSVLSAVEGHRGGRPFELQKVTFSSQEWCGHVYEEVRLGDGELRGDLDSYFEREGRQSYELTLPDGEFESEDHLLIRIRELKGSTMEAGESRSITLLPGLWQLRSAHRPRQLVKGTLTKGEEEQFTTEGGALAAIPWSWHYEGRGRRTVWVEVAYPHTILGWKDDNGDRGDLIATIRVPYWKLHNNVDEFYRETLKIP